MILNLKKCAIQFHSVIAAESWAVVVDGKDTFVEIYGTDVYVRIPVVPWTDRLRASEKFGLPFRSVGFGGILSAEEKPDAS